MSIGQGSGDIDRKWLDTLIRFVTTYRKFNHVFNVPLAGGSSMDNKVTYEDQAIPTEYTQTGGQKVEAWKYLSVHEFIEKILIDAFIKMGFPENEVYLPAHGAATAVELAAVQDDGLDVKQYDRFWGQWEKFAAKHELGDGTPPNLELAPYKEGK